jgi:hypothetical protein
MKRYMRWEKRNSLKNTQKCKKCGRKKIHTECFGLCESCYVLLSKEPIHRLKGLGKRVETLYAHEYSHHAHY